MHNHEPDPKPDPDPGVGPNRLWVGRAVWKHHAMHQGVAACPHHRAVPLHRGLGTLYPDTRGRGRHVRVGIRSRNAVRVIARTRDAVRVGVLSGMGI